MTTTSWARRLVAAARAGLAAVVVLVALVALVALLVGGRRAGLGAVAGGVVPAVVLLLTWLATELGVRRSPTAFAGLLLASYLVKLIAVMVLLVLLRDLDVPRAVLGWTAVGGLVFALVVEALVTVRTRAPYLDDPA